MISTQRVALFGARGQMGRRLEKALGENGHDVLSFDLPLPPVQRLESLLADRDILLLCVPISAFEDLLHDLKEILPPQALLADICSVKEQPLRLMLQTHRGPVLGTHPLFGPATEGELRVAITPGRNRAAQQKMCALFRQCGYTPFLTTAAEHDRAMAYIQSLNFVSTLAYLAPITSDMERFFTPSFTRRLQAAQKMLTEDAELFQAMFEANPYCLESIRTFRAYLNVAAGGDVDLLRHKTLAWLK